MWNTKVARSCGDTKVARSLGDTKVARSLGDTKVIAIGSTAQPYFCNRNGPKNKNTTENLEWKSNSGHRLTTGKHPARQRMNGRAH